MDNLDKLAGRKQASIVKNNNEFELLQSQLDEFVEKENRAVDAVEDAQYGPDSQHRLDEFVDDLEKQMDAFVKQSRQPKAKKEVATDKKAEKQHTVVKKPAPAGKAVKVAKAQKTVVQQKTVVSGAKDPVAPANSVKNISRLSIAAVVIIAAVIWVIWPGTTVETTVVPPEQPVIEKEVASEMITEPLDSPAAIEPEVAEPEKESVLPEPTDTAAAGNASAKDTSNGTVVAKQELVVKSPVHAAATPTVSDETINNSVLTVTAIVGNIRSEPNTGAEILFRLKQGTKVFALKREGDWVQVRIKGTQVWAHHSIF